MDYTLTLAAFVCDVPRCENRETWGALNIHIDGPDASAESNTAFVQDKPVLITGIGKNIWHFRKNNRTWEIISFEYDLP